MKQLLTSLIAAGVLSLSTAGVLSTTGIGPVCGIATLCGIAAVGLSGCQGDLPVTKEESPAEEPAAAQADPPKVVIDEPNYKFGSMEVGQTLSHEFTIKNGGTGVLKLKKDRSTCKCTMADFEEREVQPNESTTIRLEWIAKVLDPAFSQAAFITTNDPDLPELELRIEGRVDQSFDISPAGAWNLGEMKADRPTEFRGRVSSRVMSEFEVTGFQIDNPLVTCKAVPLTAEQLEQDGLKGGCDIVGEVAAGSPIGRFFETVIVNIKVGEEEKYALFEIDGYYSGPMQIMGPSGWIASDMLMVMGRFSAEEGKKVNLSMFLRDNSGPPVEVTKMTADPKFLKFEMTKDTSFKGNNRERYNLLIEVPPGSPSVAYEKINPGKIEIETNNPALSKMVFYINMITY